MRRRRGFFDQRGVLLGHLVHLADGLIDLLDAGALLLRCRRDFAHDVGHALTDSTISLIVLPASSTSFEPASTRSTDSPISSLISLAALALRWASVRTSPATTAKPRPCSPARAASTAALSARMLVWNAMPSITVMISATFG